MLVRTQRLLLALLLIAAPAAAQSTNDPFPTPIPATDGVIRVNFREFVTLPDIDGRAARMMLIVNEPGTRRLFVNDMRGPLYTVSYDGRAVAEYVNINETRWSVSVQSMGQERGFQSFAFHPQFGQAGTPGYGKFYTYTDTDTNQATPDFRPGGGNNTHHTVLLEWTARNAAAPTYDGGPPRELIRLEQPFANHNAGYISFREGAAPGDADFGLLYIGIADGGSGGDPLNVAQNLGNAFGKVFRIDPLGSNSTNGKYGIPASNPFLGANSRGALPEIYAYGIRNAQRFAWDPRNGDMFLSDIGQNVVEKVSRVPAGGNLGWRDWEGSFAFGSREVSLANPRSDPGVTYPVVEYDQTDPLLQNSSAASGLIINRSGAIPQLQNLLIFGDLPSGEIFYVSADDLPQGGQDRIRRILFNSGGEARTLLQLVQAKNQEQGKNPVTRADMRLGVGPDNQIMVLNKGDGVVRLLVE